MNRALCPECGKPMRFDRNVDAWDCGPNEEGGHGFWDPSPSLEREQDSLDWEENRARFANAFQP